MTEPTSNTEQLAGAILTAARIAVAFFVGIAILLVIGGALSALTGPTTTDDTGQPSRPHIQEQTQ